MSENVRSEIGWSAPKCRVDAGTALRGILWQHQQIRAFLAKALLVAERALDDEASSGAEVASTIGDLRSTMEVHLAFEEKVLLPLLADDEPLGPRRADRLLHEHREQREVLAKLHHEACAYPLLPTLAAKLVFLSSWLLADMAEEERSLLTPDAIKDPVSAAG